MKGFTYSKRTRSFRSDDFDLVGSLDASEYTAQVHNIMHPCIKNKNTQSMKKVLRLFPRGNAWIRMGCL